jgi:hypothetical protein
MQVHIGYTRCPKNYNLTPSRKKLGKAIARGSMLTVALKCVEDDRIRPHIVRKIGQLVKGEIVNLCSKKVQSVLHSQSRESLMDFKWEIMIEEMCKHAPILLEILKYCTSTKRPRANRRSVLVMCVAMLCKLRCSDMSLAHKVLSLILHAGHSSKKVSDHDNEAIALRLDIYTTISFRFLPDFTNWGYAYLTNQPPGSWISLMVYRYH